MFVSNLWQAIFTKGPGIGNKLLALLMYTRMYYWRSIPELRGLETSFNFCRIHYLLHIPAIRMSFLFISIQFFYICPNDHVTLCQYIA